MIGFFTSCSNSLGVLKETVYSELTTDNAFTTADDAISAIYAAYEPLPSIFSSAMYNLNDMTTDDCFKKESLFELLNDEKMTSNEDVDNVWKALYRVVGRCNIIIDKVPNIPEGGFTTKKTTRDHILGEAYFLRGMAYYYLTDLFYTVPMVTSSTVAKDAILARASVSDLDTQIDKDLAQASTMLPESYSSQSDAGRATVGAALGYLCRLHMRKAGRMRLAGVDAAAEWTKASGYADQILSMTSVYSLQANVWDIYDPTRNQCLYNNELIFAVHSNANSQNGTTDIALRFTPWEYDCGWDLFSMPLSLIWQFNRNDERLTTLTVTKYQDIYQPNKITYVIPTSVEYVGAMDKTFDNGTIQYEMPAGYTKKYMYTKALTYNYNTGNNMILLRLADIVLCKAEILNELNGPTQASIDLINKIRKRAFQSEDYGLKLANYSTKESLRSAICDERLFELNTEGVRRSDLVRMGLWKDRMDKYIATIKLESQYKESNALASTGTKQDYSSMWKVYPSDLTETDARRYFSSPKREVDLNADLGKNRDFSQY